ncbi:MAG: hypothetical protein ACOCUQ_02880 [Bacteroidota bacterium]
MNIGIMNNQIKLTYKIAKKIVLLLILVLFTFTNLNAGITNEGVLYVTGVVEKGKDPIDEAEIKVYLDNQLVYSDQSNNKGWFSFNLDIGYEYIAEFTAPGMITKKLAFDTSLEGKNTNETYFEFDFAVELFPEVEGIDFSFFDDPLSTIAYIDEIKRFFFRESETSPRLRKANQIHRDVVDLVRRRDSYDKQIRQADMYFDTGNLDMAKSSYEEASGFLPEKEYPKEKIAEIEALKAERMKNQSEYNKLIASADQDYKKEMYESARQKYRQAALLMSGDSFANNKIAKIDELIKQKEDDTREYNRLISIADAAFESKSYDMAKLRYQQAADLMPGESYPDERVLEIDKIKKNGANTDAEYAKLIQKADNYFGLKKLENAKKYYQSAQSLKPSESYPQNRLSLINQMLDEQTMMVAKQKEKEKQQKEDQLRRERELREKQQLEEQKEKEEQKALALQKEKERKEELKRKQEEEERLALLEEQKEREEKRKDELKRKQEEEEKLALLKEQSEKEKQEALEKQQEKEKNAALDKEEQKKKLEEEELAKQRDFERRKAFAQEQQKENSRQKKAEKQKSTNESDVFEYNKALKEGDKYFSQKQYYQSRDAYQLALSYRPGDQYCEEKIREINSIFAKSKEMETFYSQGFFDVSNVREKILNNDKKKYFFVPFDKRRTGSYLLMEANNVEGKPLRLYVNYGYDNTKNGGFSIVLDAKQGVSDIMINISSQNRWISEKNNWVSIYPLGGEIDVHNVKVFFGDQQAAGISE